MSEIKSELYQYFSQLQELYPGDFFDKPMQKAPASIPNAQSKSTSSKSTNYFLDSGSPQNKIYFVCTRPLKGDFESGHLLSGKAGTLFDKILNAIDLTRQDVYILPLREISADGKILKQSVKNTVADIIAKNTPKIIISLGENAGNELLNTQYQLSKIHGEPMAYNHSTILFTYHPEIVRRNKNLKRPVWEDFKTIKELIS